ncbi:MULTISPECIES: TonB-dependent receptor [Sphingomonas]|uniref:TonB-dependent receptor n=1 Tax=Sphingomonas lycopersici TaxID=2951807 RepID=A0AA41ZCX6_9SPHN|nr:MULTISPECIES: TonB-dependent receptor [Sphingomonas]MCW6532654.1 TonB-dependent receptor [Sphingomonas lycopersici]MCW6537338.1 TonB-dependent receptor [Sphingomonas lycopersici]
MRKFHLLLNGIAAGTIAAAIGATPAAAQTAPDATAQTPPADRTDGDIVVTAQKREQRLQDVPISMEVVSGQKVADFAAADFKAVQNFVPNMFVQQTNGNDTIYIRGFGSPPQNFSFDQAVSVYMDGVYAGKMRQALNPFFDVARVEVMRGPQGALYGKNTPAGAISVVSAGPTKTFEGGITGSYNFDLEGYDLTGYVSGPVSDTLSLRVATRLQNQDGYIHNLGTGKDDPRNKLQLFRVSALWEPTDNFSLSGKVEMSNYEREGGLGVSSPTTTAQQPKLVRYTVNSPLGQEGYTNRSVLGSVTANLKVGTHTLTSITGYSWFNGSVTNYFDQQVPGTGQIVENSVANKYPENFHQFSEELRLLSPTGGTLEYVVGAYYDRSTYNVDPYLYYNLQALNLVSLNQTYFHQQARTVSVFGQATLRPAAGLRIIGSLRYTNTHKDGRFSGALLGGKIFRPLTSATGSISEGLADPSVTVQYDVSRNLMVYAVYGRGSKSGGFVSNTLGTTNATFTYRPERSRNWEAGIKSTLLDGKATLNVSVYDTKFTDLQTSGYDPDSSTYITKNAAAASSKGVEGSLRIAPSRYFDITASAAYQDIKYDSYPGAPCLAGMTGPICDLSGHRLPYTSKFTGNVSVHGRADIGDYKLDGTAIVGGRSGYFDSDDQSPLYGYQKGYAKLDLRIQFAPQDERWHIAFVGKNLTNNLTTGSAFRLPFPITTVTRSIIFVEPPRNLAIEAGVKF